MVTPDPLVFPIISALNDLRHAGFKAIAPCKASDLTTGPVTTDP